jgi:sec-independent protein translocase protein TatA
MLPQLGLLEMMIVMGVAVLLFGKRLPEVGRSLGKGIIEFKKGLAGLEDTFDMTSTSVPSSSHRAARYDEHVSASTTSDHVETAVPKFELPTSPPTVEH